jgi:hypothetical protein
MEGSVVRYMYQALCLVILFALAACTRMDLAYRNLDTLIPWTLDDYLDMNREQKAWFESELEDHLRWHCQTQLPGYLPWLDRLQAQVATQQVSDSDLQALTQEGEQAAQDIARQITPSAVQLLRELDDGQVTELRDAFAKDIAKRRKEQVAPPLDAQVQDRAARMHKRLQPWLGNIHEDQDAAIQHWSAQLGEHNRVALDARAAWQNALLAALAQRNQPGFEGQVVQLLQHRDSLWSQAYRNDHANSQAAARQLTIEIMRLSDAPQRQTLAQQLHTLRERFAALRCLKKQ